MFNNIISVLIQVSMGVRVFSAPTRGSMTYTWPGKPELGSSEIDPVTLFIQGCLSIVGRRFGIVIDRHLNLRLGRPLKSKGKKNMII